MYVTRTALGRVHNSAKAADVTVKQAPGNISSHAEYGSALPKPTLTVT